MVGSSSTHGPHEDAPVVLDLEAAFPLRRIGADGEIGRAGADELPLRRPDRNAGIHRGHAGFVRQQRIDVEFADLGNVGRHLRQLDQHHGDGIVLDRWHVTIGL